MGENRNHHYAALFGHMCDFARHPPLLFAIPELDAAIFLRLLDNPAPVELVVPDLEAFCVPEEDLERIQWAIDAACALD
jgi:hypothetical protein